MKTGINRALLLWGLAISTVMFVISAASAQSIPITPTISYSQQETDVVAEDTTLTSQSYPRLAVPHTDPTSVAAAMRSGAYNRKVTYVISHRGYHSSPGCPEVSVCSIKAAYEAGSDGIELDTKLTSTNEVIMGHDFSVGRELNDWANKPATGNWGPFTYYPSLDPYYYLSSKPPKYLDVNQNLATMSPPLPENPLNEQRIQHPLADFYGHFMKDHYDIPSASQTQLTLYQALYLVQTKYPMMIWLDIKDWQTLQYAAGVIKDIQSRVGTGTGPIYHIALKLGSNVVVEASNTSQFYPYGTQTLAQNLGLGELNYFWVFGTADLDKIVGTAATLGITGSTSESILEQAVDKFCPPTRGAATGCLGIELVHKYYGAPTQALYNHLNSNVSTGSGPQLASFQQVLQYQWYWETLTPVQQALANENTIIRADGSCCIALMETLNQSPTFGAESEDDRARWDWNENYFTSITTDEPALVLADLQKASLRDSSSLTALGATTAIRPTTQISEGLYRLFNADSHRAVYLTQSSGDVDATTNALDQTQMWYISPTMNPSDPTNTNYVTIRSAKNGAYLSADNTTQYGSGFRITTLPASQALQPSTLWMVFSTTRVRGAFVVETAGGTPIGDIVGNSGSSVVVPISGTPANRSWFLTAITPQLSTTPLYGPTSSTVPSPIGPPGYIFCASQGGNCSVPVGSNVAYGTNGVYFFSTFSVGNVNCDVGTFGGDPVPNFYKSCFYSPTNALPAPPPNSLGFCAMGDYGVCQFPNPTNPTIAVSNVVAYGSAAANEWQYQVASNFISCNPAAFGSTSNVYNTASTNACFLTSNSPTGVPGQVSNLSAVAGAQNIMTVSWTAPNTPNVAVTAYNVTWTPNATSGSTCTSGSASISGSSKAYVIQNLCAGLQYTIGVTAISFGGSGPTATVTAIAGVVTVVPGSAAITAGWSPFVVTTTSYLVNLLNSFGVVEQSLNVTGTTVTFHGLTPGNTYTVAVTANSGGAQITSNVVQPTDVNWTPCASENATCSFSPLTTPQFVNFYATYISPLAGLSGYSRVTSVPTVCSDSVFGDPDPGYPKACVYTAVINLPNSPDNSLQIPGPVFSQAQQGLPSNAPGTWIFCAYDGDICTFPASSILAYGSYGSFIAYNPGASSGSLYCKSSSSSTLPNRYNACFYKQSSPTLPGTPTVTGYSASFQSGEPVQGALSTSQTLSWSPPGNLGSPYIDHYAVTLFRNGVPITTVNVDPTKTTYQFDCLYPLNSSTTYTMGVSAVSSSGASSVVQGQTWKGVYQTSTAPPDLFGVYFGNGTNAEVHQLSGASNYLQWDLQVITALPDTLNGEAEFRFASCYQGNSGTLFAVQTKNTASTSMELNILKPPYSSVDNFVVLPIPGDSTDGWEWHVADWDQDGIPDIGLIHRKNTASGFVEVQFLTGVSNYQIASPVMQTPLTTPDGVNYTYNFVDSDHDGLPDLVGIKTQVTAGSTEVHILSGASQFTGWLVQSTSVLPNTTPIDIFHEGNTLYALKDWNGDGTPDLLEVLKNETPFTSLNLLSGVPGKGGAYSSYLLGPVYPTGEYSTDTNWDWEWGEW